jgi:hypothetical protein
MQTRLPGGPLIAAHAYWRGNGGGSQEAPVDRVLSRKHRRYLQILADPRDEVQRRIILKLLAEEEAAVLREATLGGAPGIEPAQSMRYSI